MRHWPNRKISIIYEKLRQIAKFLIKINLSLVCLPYSSMIDGLRTRMVRIFLNFSTIFRMHAILVLGRPFQLTNKVGMTVWLYLHTYKRIAMPYAHIHGFRAVTHTRSQHAIALSRWWTSFHYMRKRMRVSAINWTILNEVVSIYPYEVISYHISLRNIYFLF